MVPLAPACTPFFLLLPEYEYLAGDKAFAVVDRVDRVPSDRRCYLTVSACLLYDTFMHEPNFKQVVRGRKR